MAEQVTTETTRTTTHTQVQEKPSVLSNVLAIIGFIILIIIVLWGLFHIASLSQPWFSSLFNRTEDTVIKVTAPANATSSEPITVSWKYSTSEKGTYAFLYQCRYNFRFASAGANGTLSTIPCGAASTISGGSSAVSVTPILSGATSTPVTLTILFMPSATTSKQAHGNATVLVHQKVGAMVPEPTPVTPVTPAQPAVVKPVQKPINRGPADLSVNIISVTVDGSGMAVATFNIGNVGGRSSGSYYFTAQLPMQGGYTYTSPLQSSLAPGDHVVSTLRFAQAISGNVSVVVDPQNMVSESSEANNYATQYLNAPYNYNYPQYQYPYQPYPQPYQYPYVY